jgi:parvulin-like peptidyl-prolyl isomerase
MKSQTARRPDNQPPTRSAQSSRVPSKRRYSRQTAHVEARRTGTPLILGWGGHLSHNEKVALQRRAVWSAIILTVLVIIAVFVGYWININVVVPNQPITSVNGQNIPQSDYHRLVGLRAQLEQNKISGKHGLNAQRDALSAKSNAQQKVVDDTQKQITALDKQITALPAGSSIQRTDLQNQLTTLKKQNSDATALHTQYDAQYQAMLQTTIPGEQALYNQSQLGTDSAQWLQDDVFIRNWLAKQNSSVQNTIQPGSAAIEQAVNAFKADLPTGTTYASVLSAFTINDNDVHTMMALKLRRDNMQTYEAQQISSPARQVKARAITLSTTNDANSVLSQLKSGSDFAKLAASKSVDTATKNLGGELGWLAKGQYIKDYSSNVAGTVDNWLSDPARQVNEISPVLSENGTYHIVQIEQIDPSRAIDSAKLTELKDNALTAWLLSQKALPGVNVGQVDQTKLLDPINMPQSIPASAPSQQGAPAVDPNTGLPAGSAPGGASGLPSQGAPGQSAPGQSAPSQSAP